jgi:sugar lactone lactonase YvrE
VGSGLAGFTDGSYAEASFRKPQGIAAIGDVLYVADTENHAIRAVDLRAEVVKTVAGTGEIGAGPIVGEGPAREIKLRSPWDIVAVGDKLYVALAGSHQVAAFSPKEGTLAPFAGDGQERRVDGVGMAASFAQPSGLATDGSTLFVADSETSSIRTVSIATRQVKTLVGRDLFVFGDVDGPASGVRFEHPLGVAWADGAVWAVDTYNSKLKRIDPVTGETHTVVGGRDHKALFEPEGIAAAGSDLLVADTKHHRIVRVKRSDGSAQPIALTGLTVPSAGVAVAAPAPTLATDRIVLGDVPLLPTGETVVHFGWRAPAGTGVNEEAPFHLDWTSSDGLALVPTPLRTTGASVHDGFDIKVTPIAGGEGGRLEGQLSLVICDVTTHRVCVPVRRAIELTFRTATSKTDARTVMIPLPEAKP